ncbi:MAG: hypothetical protein U1B94_08665, partial [candidate division NC10 bacterium]|nr:hypothetical protein [candidate division NC10 bacterium]
MTGRRGAVTISPMTRPSRSPAPPVPRPMRRHPHGVGRMTALPLASLVAMAAMSGTSARAQTVVTLEPIVVSATRIPTPLAATPLSATIVTREEIEARLPLRT